MNESLTAPKMSRHTPLIYWLALAGWMLIALLYIGLFLVNVLAVYSELRVTCAGEQGVFAECDPATLTPAEEAVWTSWGLTLETYSAIYVSGSVFALMIYLALAGLILWQQGRSRLGLTLSLALVVIPFFMYAGNRDFGAINPILVWPGFVTGALGAAVTFTFLYLMPNGRFSPRWAYIPLIATVLMLSILGLAEDEHISLPAPAFSLLIITIVSLILFGTGTQIYRYVRDSNSVERQQTRWIIFAIVIFVSGFITWGLVYGNVLAIPAGRPRIMANILGMIYTDFFAIPLLPVAITIAILRYRLWGIDVIIRKTLVYLLLSGLLALVYFGMVIILQRLFNTFTSQQSPIVIVISTLTIAALFTPLRRRVQTFIDRRFFRQKYDAQQVLAQFAQTARDEVAIDVLTAELSVLVQETMQPEKVTLWLKKDWR